MIDYRTGAYPISWESGRSGNRRALGQEFFYEPRPIRRANHQVAIIEIVLRVVQHGSAFAIAQSQEAAGLVLQVIGEIFTASDRSKRRDGTRLTLSLIHISE